MAQGRKTNGGNGVLIVLGILILAAMIAVILGFCTNWYRDWTRFGIGGGEQQEEQLPDETPDGEEGEQQAPDDGQEEQLPDETPDGEEGEQQTPDDGQEPAGQPGGMTVGKDTESGIKMTSVKIAKADYAANGVSEQAESAYQLKATLDMGNDKYFFDWNVSFRNSGSAWASGRNAADYVTITPTSDGSDTALAECKQAFGEQIVITCTVRGLTGLSATCTVDYAQKIEGVDVWFEKYDKAGTVDGTRTEIAAGEEVNIPMRAENGQSMYAYILKAEAVLSDTYTLAETATVKVSFLTSAGENDAHKYFTDGSATGTGGSWSRSIDEIPDALNPKGYVYTEFGGWMGPYPISWNNKPYDAFYTFDDVMLKNFRAKITNNSSATGETVSTTNYYYEMTQEELKEDYETESKGTVLWRVVASAEGKYGSYTRPDSYIMYYRN